MRKTDSRKESEEVSIADSRKEVPTVDQITSFFKDLFDNEHELELYKMTHGLPDGMIMNVSIYKNENGMRKINLDVRSWNEEYQRKIQSLFKEINDLYIRTETPETVLPWILQFPNLRILDIDISEEALKTDSEMNIDRSQIKLDMESMAEIAAFNGSLTITFYCDLYEKNPHVQGHLLKLFTKFKDMKKLRELRISQYLTSLMPNLINQYKAAREKKEND